MPLQLRVLATGQLLEIPNEGQTIGREGGQAEVQLKDNGLSGRHARIFADGSEWLIQDLGSSNGTLVGGVKINATTPIQLDDIITMGATKFEVAKVWDAQVQQTMMVPAPIFDTVPTGTPAVQRRTAPSAKPSAPRPAATVQDQPAVEEQEPSMAPTMLGGVAAMDPALIGVPQPELEAKVKKPEAKSKKAPAAKVEAEEEAEAPAEAPAEDAAVPPDDAAALGQGGFKYFMVAVPKAIAFYLAAIPLLIVNPIGYVRKGIAEQKHEAMGKMQLIAYALPALFISAFLPSIAAGIALLVHGTFSLMSFIPIGPAISAVIGAVVAGFLFHPVMKWIIEKLKGSSDEKSRTNYFLMLMTATAVLAVPTAVSTLLTLIPVPFIGFVGVLISIVASAASVFILYSWLVYFDVMKVVRTVVLVLGGLGALGSLYGGVMAQVALIRGMGSSGGGTVAVNTAGMTPEQAEAVAKAQKMAEEAMEKGKAAQEQGSAALAEAKEKTDEAVKEAKAEGKKVAAVEPGEKPAEKPAAAAAPEEATSVTYPVYAQMRDAVEKAINDDPALLTNRPELVPLYKEYTNATFEVDSKFKALNEKNPADAKLNAKLRDAELFQKTEKAIVALHAKIKPGPAPKGGAKEAAPAPAPAAKEEKKPAEKTEAKPAPAAKEEKKAEAKPAPAAKEEKKAEAKPAPAAKEEKKAEAKPAPAAKEEKKAEAKPAPAAKEEKKPAGKGKLACSSKPGGAEIWVDGKNTGKKTPVAPSSPIELPAGKHTVLFKLNGKSSAAQEINVEPGGQVTLKGVEIPG